MDEGADTIVLGCTHYPFVREAIADIVGKDIILVDTGSAVANHLQHRLAEEGLQSSGNQVADVVFWTNSEAENAKQVIFQLWQNDLVDVSIF